MSDFHRVFVPSPKQITRCRGCRRPIFFAITPDDRRIPIDEKPTSDGNLYLAGVSSPTAIVVRPGQAAGMREAGIPTYRAHFATCPNADDFRKKARARR
ncbi:hypothetical protein Y710_16580 [Gordonia sp. QH-12]|uniref:hypothetical protein n=1 Tax=Gordonia TaxID=2053 RepID=UPI0007829922|nr:MULTISPECIES: hypothetical protein [Gordonia]KXT55954.1 hypothetical protein Y710_16580 [Gordonia sp. QH-12]WFN94136.1 hypothetical protein P5P27_06210 [Gordonia sihwensis]WFN94197.1 hypothetical protein P5P27_06520 [Gordonia sihwensis]